MSDSDSDIRHSSSDDSDSSGEAEEDSVNDEEDFLGDDDRDDDLGEFDVYNQLYILEMILCFHAWYRHGVLYPIGTNKGYLKIDKAI